MDHLQRITKIAFPATAGISVKRIARVVEDEECTHIYLVGENSELLEGLLAAGLTIHQVAAKDEVPADVLHYVGYSGYWASLNIETGALREVSFSEDNVMASRILLSRYAQDFRKQFCVRPVQVTPLDGF